VETPHKFITAVINLSGVSTNKTIIYFIAMQTYKELITKTYISLLTGISVNFFEMKLVQVLAPIFACILDCFLVHAGRHRRCDF
jgi:hypothetical protein